MSLTLAKLTQRVRGAPSAQALSVNLTVTGPTQPGDLRLFLAARPRSLRPSTIHPDRHGPTTRWWRSAPTEPSLSSGQTSGTVDFILDVNGYFE
jgi:hypothetical protein